MNFEERFNIPTEEEFEEMHKEHYKESLENLNNYSYWFPKIYRKEVLDCFKISESYVYKLDYEHHRMIRRFVWI